MGFFGLNGLKCTQCTLPSTINRRRRSSAWQCVQVQGTYCLLRLGHYSSTIQLAASQYHL
jgi:hypothetical protein